MLLWFGLALALALALVFRVGWGRRSRLDEMGFERSLTYLPIYLPT